MAQVSKAQALVDAELARQSAVFGYTPSRDAIKSTGDFIIYMDTYLTKAKHAYASHEYAAKKLAEHELVKVLALGHAYFNSRCDPVPGQIYQNENGKQVFDGVQWVTWDG